MRSESSLRVAAEYRTNKAEVLQILWGGFQSPLQSNSVIQ